MDRSPSQLGGPVRTHGSSGFRRARVREAQHLPLGWRHLTSVEIQRLRETLGKAAHPKASLAQLEACLLVWSSLTTGREFEDLTALEVSMTRSGDDINRQPPGLVSRAGRLGWWLRAPGPAGQIKRLVGMRTTSSMIYLPVTKSVHELMTRCIALRRRASRGGVQLSAVPVPIFTDETQAVVGALELIASSHPVGPHRARRAASTSQAIARWLPAELLGQGGGDIVPASIITGNIKRWGQTQTYYGAVDYRVLADSYAAAIGAIDMLAHRDYVGETVRSALGDTRTPTDATVRALLDRLGAALEDSATDLADKHLAMMRYTVALLCFATAHRGTSGTLPSTAGVHPETRFYWIRDKTIGGRATRRLAWISDMASEQLALYDRHVARVLAAVSPIAADTIRSLSGPHLPLFDLTRGAVEPWTVRRAATDALRQADLPPNSGRHWLRGKLVGRVSTETLHALLDHGPVKEGSWDTASTLDPVAYRADLAQSLDHELAAAGWSARGAVWDAAP